MIEADIDRIVEISRTPEVERRPTRSSDMRASTCSSTRAFTVVASDGRRFARPRGISSTSSTTTGS